MLHFYIIKHFISLTTHQMFIMGQLSQQPMKVSIANYGKIKWDVNQDSFALLKDVLEQDHKLAPIEKGLYVIIVDMFWGWTALKYVCIFWINLYFTEGKVCKLFYLYATFPRKKLQFCISIGILLHSEPTLLDFFM